MNNCQASGSGSQTESSRRIVAFTKDWDDVPTCTTHILRSMARTIPVLWIGSIGVRRPMLSSHRDVRRVFARLRQAGARARIVEHNIRVLSPLLIPSARSRSARAFNRLLLHWQISRELADMGQGGIEYWCFVPNAVDFLPKRGGVRCRKLNVERGASDVKSVPAVENATTDKGQRTTGHDDSVVVYYCVDDWGKFEGLDGGWLERKEREILKCSDVVFTPSRYLERKCLGLLAPSSSSETQVSGFRFQGSACPSVHRAPHGVEYDKFAAALDRTGKIPDDIACLPKPVIGFYGNIYPWIDFRLVEALAAARPAWFFAMIGQIYCDVSRLRALPNVRFLGRREHDLLPGYCRAFDSAMIPYDLNHPRMESVNPVKTKELLAAGVPIVAARLPELEGYGDDVMTCVGIEQWIGALEKQILRTDRAGISGRVADEDWSVKVRWIRETVDVEGGTQDVGCVG